jgi:5-formyltetrahydrofolate cyclo-ligase
MSSDITLEKSQLRKIIRDRMIALTPALHGAASMAVCLRLKRQAFFQNATNRLFFAPLPGEINIWPLVEETLAAGGTVALPRFNPDTQSYEASLIKNLATDLIIGPYELREPSPNCPTAALDEFDLILVPGIGFDVRGNRLGRGKGYYDRMLSMTRGYKCGVGFEEQIVKEIPSATHDVRMDSVITPNRRMDFGGIE